MESNQDTQAFLKSEIERSQPRNILQMGLGGVDETLMIADLLEQVSGAALTLIESPAGKALKQDKDARTKLNALCERASVERIGAPFDEVLPDFYFQHHCWDMVIVNPLERFDQALVALYYLDKMLLSQGSLLLWGTDTPVMAKVCHHLQSESGYILIEQSDKANRARPLKTKLLKQVLDRAPAWIRRLAHSTLNPQLLGEEKPGGEIVYGEAVLLRKPLPENESDMDFDTLLAVLSKE
ncbi:MAG: hypothetical protein H7A00_00250 [Hahellaceae bacterium]|nr:hypothetical protein [Hahellaceae bacterium]